MEERVERCSDGGRSAIGMRDDTQEAVGLVGLFDHEARLSTYDLYALEEGAVDPAVLA